MSPCVHHTKRLRKREKALFDEEPAPAFQSGRAGAHEDSHPIPLVVRSLLRGRGGIGRRGSRDPVHLAVDYGVPKANNPDEPADQESNLILIGAETKHGLAVERTMPDPGLRNETFRRMVGWPGQPNRHSEVRQRASHPWR